MIKEKIIAIHIGKPNFERPNGKLSAIRKNTQQQQNIFKDHLPGDEVADHKHHGGLKRVIHHYSIENYTRLMKKFPEHKDKFIPGSYGENITTQNLSEKDLFLGDIFKLGSATVELTIPREPCSTIDDTYEFRGVLKEIISNSHYGWFYRVLEEGKVVVGDELELIDRPHPKLNLHQMIKMVRRQEPIDIEFVQQALKVDALDEKWHAKLEKIASQTKETV